jgi:hypothetical protein
MNTTSPAIEVVTDGPAADSTAHRRYFNPADDTKYTTPATSPYPLCKGKPEKGADLSGWRQYSLGLAVELGAALCTDPACFGDASGGAA